MANFFARNKKPSMTERIVCNLDLSITADEDRATIAGTAECQGMYGAFPGTGMLAAKYGNG